MVILNVFIHNCIPFFINHSISVFTLRYSQRKSWVNILIFLDKLPIDVGDVVEDEPPVGEVDHPDSTDGSPAYRVGYPARNGERRFTSEPRSSLNTNLRCNTITLIIIMIVISLYWKPLKTLGTWLCFCLTLSLFNVHSLFHVQVFLCPVAVREQSVSVNNQGDLPPPCQKVSNTNVLK